jgi:hypothetical protein
MSTTADEVWQLLGELIESQKETERLLKEQSQESDRRFRETEHFLKQQSQETDRLLKEQSQESDRRFLETEQLLREQSHKTDRQIQQVNQQLGKLGNRLGEFAEWQVRPAAVRLFQERGINVHELYPGASVQRAEGGMEIDLLVVNETEAVLIEIKSKLTQSDVDEHLERLAKFKQFMPRYRDVKALGAVAAMIVPEDVARYAYRRGLFVIAQSGDDLVILNDDKFQPKAW